jgi:hypothetical protein
MVSFLLAYKVFERARELVWGGAGQRDKRIQPRVSTLGTGRPWRRALKGRKAWLLGTGQMSLIGTPK